MSARSNIIIVLALTAAACAGGEPPGNDIEPGAEQSAATDTPAMMAGEDTSAMGGAAMLAIDTLQGAGAYLTDSDGRALYLFTSDTQGAGTSACADDCIMAWPPLLVSPGAQVMPPTGADASLIGTIERADGSTQVTWNGWPLYYYAQDTRAGMTSGQDVHDAGGEWYLVTPQGEKLEGGEGGS